MAFFFPTVLQCVSCQLGRHSYIEIFQAFPLIWNVLGFFSIVLVIQSTASDGLKENNKTVSKHFASKDKCDFFCGCEVAV